MTDSQDPKASLQKRNATLVLILVGIIALGAVVAFNYTLMLKKQREEEKTRPRFEQRIEKDREFLDQNGQPFSLKMLQGKTYLVSYVFTHCPNQCIGVIESVKEMAAEFPDQENLEFVAVSLEPDVDRPEVLKEWAQLHDVDSAKWHFLTTPEVGETEALHEYMTDELWFYPVVKIDGPEKYEHDPRVALVDGMGNVRGYYDLLSLESPEAVRETMKRQMKQVLIEKPKHGPILIWFVVAFGIVFLLCGLLFASGAAKHRKQQVADAKAE